MRKLSAAVLCLIFILASLVSVFAATGITGGSLSAAVSSNGSCQVTLDLQLHLEAGASGLEFPLPGNARSITINGKTAHTSRSGDVVNVKLSSVLGNVTGDFPVRIQYTLPNVVAYNDSQKLMLTLPLLSGFGHPIQGLDFSISLPGNITGRPTFTSGYYLQTIESSLKFTVSGSSISGNVFDELKDRETLTMTLEVTEEMFPQDPIQQWTVGLEEILMIVVSVLALLYWIFSLRCAPFISRRSAVPPEGCTAGEFSGLLGGRGNDLTMMVFSWAQLGYIMIHLQRNGRVTLYKRMDMGNERGPEEVRVFRSLFGKRPSVDGTGYHYAHLYRKVAAAPSGALDLYKRTSGNPRLFRILCAIIGLLSGISLGRAIVGNALLGFLLIAILAVLGGVSAWIMQDWVKGLHLHDKTALYLGLGLAAVWSLLGTAAGIWNVTVCVSAAQLLCGLATAYGGRRTVLGRQLVSQTLGFRRYLKKLGHEEASRIIRSDPDYFFTMAPYALALGVGSSFSGSFRAKKFPPCTYLTTGREERLTAREWMQIFQKAAHSLDARPKWMFLERVLGK